MSILKDYIVPGGVILTFIGTIISIYFTRKSSRSTKFIDTITSERIKWIEKLRLEVSDLSSCFLTIIKNHHFIIQIEDKIKSEKGLFGSISSLTEKESLKNEISSFSKTDILRKINTIRLRLNPTEDEKILNCLNELMNFTLGEDFNKENVTQAWETNLLLIGLTQTMLKQEWEKVKLEAKS